MFNSKPTIKTTTMHCINKHHGNIKIKSHNHNDYLLLYKQAEQETVSLACQKWYILLVTWVLVICLTCMPLGLWPSGFRNTYQANPSYPCDNYYIKHYVLEWQKLLMEFNFVNNNAVAVFLLQCSTIFVFYITISLLWLLHNDAS